MINVVLVDDEPFLLKLLESTIQWKDYGMAVTGTFYNGRQALDYITSNEVDVVISDIKMPVMDGMELIRELKKVKPEVEFIVLSAYSEFELVRDFFRIGAFDYLTKIDIDSDQTVEVLTRVQQEINRKNSAGGAEQELEVILSNEVGKLGLGDRDRIVVLSSRIVNRNYLSEFNSFVNSGAGRQTPGICYNTNSGEAVYLLPYTPGLVKAVEDIGTGFQQIPYQIVGGYSTADYPDRMKALLEEARKGANYSFYLNGEIVYYQDIPVRKNSVQAAESVVLDRCKAYISSNPENLNLMKITDKIGELFDTYKKYNLLYTELIASARDIFLYLNCLLRETCNIDYILEEKLNQELLVIEDVDTFEKMKALLIEYLNIVISGIHQEGTSGLMERVRFYINSNYDKELSLKAIARQFGISENYLSRLFVKESNITFKRYVNALKLNKAKEYLENTSLRIGEICEQLGYRNVEHFSRLFKEEMGCSPSEYRNLCKQTCAGVNCANER